MTRLARSDPGSGLVPLVVVLGLGFAFRALILAILPGSGFQVDISSFSFWATNLASQGLNGFYDRPFFHDYTPGYLYVLWLIGTIANLVGGAPGDLVKVPAILSDIALAWLVWSMVQELGGSRRAAVIGAFIVVVNPVTWVDSALWGQVDSVGVVVLLFALRELWRDRPERSAVLAMLAALVKPQLGILIPIVAAVTIRRALWPAGGYGDDDPAEVQAGGTAWERRVHGPIRILTTALSGLATAVALSLPFGLSLPDLIGQLFKTAAGYPYLSVNAYNPWALVSLNGHGVSADRSWVCDSTVLPSGPFDIRIGDFVLYHAGATTLSCPDAFMVGPLPAVVVGMGLFLVAAAIVVWLVARRPDRRTMLVGLTVLAIAFFVLPTRVHERYLFPLVGLGAILAAVSLRWRLAYLVASAAMLANLYAVLTTLYPNNPGISDWLNVGDVVTSWWGIAVAAVAQVAVLVFAVVQLRGGPIEDLQDEIDATNAPDDEADLGPAGWAPFGGAPAVAARTAGGAGRSPATLWSAPPGGKAMIGAPADATAEQPGPTVLVPAWDERDTASGGPWAWVQARFRDRPVRADRSATLAAEGGGRFDRLDLWIVLVLVASLSIVRVWRLSEPYDMHFDEIYHPRTAMEFLQLWKYGMSHDIYEWTHPHLAKYAMAVGLEAFGDDQVTATSGLAIGSVKDAEVEPRWDDPANARSGDRLWIAGDGQVRAYDLAARALIATWAVPDVTALSVDTSAHRVFVGTASGSIQTIDTTELDVLRAADTPVGTPPSVEPASWGDVGASIDQLHATDDGLALEVVAGDPAAASLITLDAGTAAEMGRFAVADVTQIADHAGGTVVVAEGTDVVVVSTTTGARTATATLDGPSAGLTATTGLSNDPLYVSYQGADGPMLAMVTTGTDPPSVAVTSPFRLPGDLAGPLYYDRSSRMLHAVGTSPPEVDRGTGSRETVYVIDPNGGSNAVYADAQLPFDAATAVMDDAPSYPTADRQQLLVFSASGEMGTIPVGDHAWAWRLPGVIAGVLMGALVYVLARLLFRRREVAVILGFLTLADGMLFVQSRIGMNDSYVGLGIVAAYTLFAWLWLKPGGGRRAWVAWAIGMPVLGVVLGLALASKWVAAYAIGGLGILVLARSALGRLILNLGMVGATAVLGFLAITTPGAAGGGDYFFLAIMVAFTLVSFAVTILHPVAWTPEEGRLAIFGPIAGGFLLGLGGIVTGVLDHRYGIGPIAVTPGELAVAAMAFGAAMYLAFYLAGRFGFGPMPVPPAADDARRLLDPPAPAPAGWLNLGAGFGIPALFSLACLVVIPVVVYVISYIPWAFVGQDQLFPGWPPGHSGQSLVDLTVAMYHYHNDLTSPHPASSPWWAWPLDLKPVWFYQDSFAGNTSASIYNAGNLISWWLSIPAMAFAAWQAYKRRSIALGLILVGFLVQWISWARIDRASFEYHYYTALPFLLAALAYFIAELWHGPSWRTWAVARLAGAAVILGPFALWLLNRPLCAIAQVDAMNPGSQACPTVIPDVALSPRLIGVAVVVGLGVIALLRLFLSGPPPGRTGSGGLADVVRDRLIRAGVVVGVVLVGLLAITVFVPADSAIRLRAVPIEPVAIVVELALLPIAAFVATARDARRFAFGLLAAIGLWFVIWYPNISALPLPSGLTNIFQGLLPTYLYPFQFWSNTTSRTGGPSIFSFGTGMLLVAVTAIAVAVAYSAWAWRLSAAERRAEEALTASGTLDGRR